MRPFISVDLGDAAYPTQLAAIPAAPAIIWVRGDVGRLPDSSTHAIAVVGSRSASRDGRELAAEIAGDLARAGVTIVSGLARGIDGAAHAAALDASGITIAVLGSGLDRVYPPEHVALAARIAETGAVVSEFAPDVPPHAGFFPRRNRIISGLCQAVVVVEAPEKSGALITASAALDQGREVMVVPGRVAGGRNRGGHLLIRDGAKLVESAVDILEEMGWGSMPARPQGSPELVEFTVDDLAAQTGAEPAVLLARLLELELAGEIQRIGSGRFVRTRGRVLR
jgi:DNA processing protein